MSKTDEAIAILAALGLPRQQLNERSALTLLALANIERESLWANVQRPLVRTVEIMEFMRTKYGKDYKPNTRETVRRQTLHQFADARLVDLNPDDPHRPTNSPKTAYRLSEETAKVLVTFGTKRFDKAVKNFLKMFGTLKANHELARVSQQIPLRLPDGSKVDLSSGKHNELQAAVIKEFGPRFAPAATVLYLGDTAKKHVVHDQDRLRQIGVPITKHDKLPDIVLFDQGKNWLFLIEAVTSHGPVSPKRFREIERFLEGCTAERVYITAFMTISDFRRYAAHIAWETEVWIAANPDHMIHFNGPKFLGPYRPQIT